MKNLTLKHVVLLYALIVIGCGVAPEDKNAQYLDDVYDVQFVFSDTDRSSDHHGPGSAAPADHHGPGSAAPADHHGPGSAAPADHHGPGSAAPADHHGPGSAAPADHHGPGSKVSAVNFQALVEKHVDVILIEDEIFGVRSVEFTQSKDGVVKAQFEAAEDFKLTIVSGEKEFKLESGSVR